MRCGRNTPIILVGVAFGYFWLSVIGSIICGFIFFMISKISILIVMKNKNISKKLSYAFIPFIETFAFILFIQFSGIIFSEVERIIADYNYSHNFQKILPYIFYGDIQRAFSYILLSPSDKKNSIISGRIWIIYSYNYLVITTPFLFLSQSFMYKNTPIRKEGRANRINEILKTAISSILFFLSFGVEVLRAINGCVNCGIVRKYITMNLMGKILTGLPVMVLLSMIPVYILSYLFISIRSLINNR